MWSREKLLHPATLIACAALFVSLGGVGYAAATIGTKQIRNGAVTARKIRAHAVTGTRLANGAVANAKLADRAVSTGKLGDGAVTSGKLADAAVTTGKLADAAVTTGKLADASVTTGKVADAAVTSGKLADASVATGKLADASVTTGKLADGSITSAKLSEGAAVTGLGTLRTTRLTLNDNASGVILLDLPFFGQLTASCTTGVGEMRYLNLSGTTVNVQNSGVNGGSPDEPFINFDVVADGMSTPAPNGGSGAQETTWRMSYGEGASAHVATAWVTTETRSSVNCVVAVQALVT